MGVQNFSEGTVLIVLPAEPQTSVELETVNKKVSRRCDYDVIIDFSRVEILASSSISNLIILHHWLRGCGHKLTLCNVSFATKCIFNRVELNAFFDFADDKFAALESAHPTEPRAHSGDTENPGRL